MAEVAQKMQAFVVLREGMRLLYDPPNVICDDSRIAAFMRKHRGKTATIVGFPTKLVGPLNGRGRLPGMYLEPDCVDIQFDGEEEVHNRVYLGSLLLLDKTSTMTPEEFESAQRVGDLPQPNRFYPGDCVYERGDPQRTPRLVQEVEFDDIEMPLYTLAETDESLQRRMASIAAEEANKKARWDGAMSSMPTLTQPSKDRVPDTEMCYETELELLGRGPMYFLYHDALSLAFENDEEELRFWSQDGLSTTVYSDRSCYEWPLSMAQALVEQGVGDLVVETGISQSRGHLSPMYGVRILHNIFSEYRERVRRLALATPPPAESE